MFWALKGATETPRRCSHRQSPVTTVLLPAPDDVPRINNDPLTHLLRRLAR